MRDLSTATITGNLGGEPEAGYLPTGTLRVRLRVATSTGKDETSWFSVTAFGKVGEIAQQYLHKGSRVLVSGRLAVRTWQGNDGQQRTGVEIVANELVLLDRKDAGGPAAQAQVAQPTHGQADEWGEDEIPF